VATIVSRGAALRSLAAGGVQGTRYDAHQMAMLDSER